MTYDGVNGTNRGRGTSAGARAILGSVLGSLSVGAVGVVTWVLLFAPGIGEPPHPAPPRAGYNRVFDTCRKSWAEWSARRAAVPLRELTVRVVADEEFRATAGVRWGTDVRARLRRASKFLERELRVTLRVVAVARWKSDDDAARLQDLHRAATIEFERDDVDLVVAFTSQHRGRGGASYDRGVAFYFGRSIIVRTGMPSAAGAWPYEDETVLHELLHVFGAWHVDDPTSVMRADKSGPPATRLDALGAANALLTRELDFRVGPDAIDAATWRTITYRWLNAWRWDVGHPGVDAYASLAWVAQERRDPAAARAAAARGVELANRLRIPNVQPWIRDVAAGK